MLDVRIGDIWEITTPVWKSVVMVLSKPINQNSQCLILNVVIGKKDVPSISNTIQEVGFLKQKDDNRKFVLLARVDD